MRNLLTMLLLLGLAARAALACTRVLYQSPGNGVSLAGRTMVSPPWCDAQPAMRDLEPLFSWS